MASQFSARTLAEIFRDIYLGERTGYLVLSREDLEKRVHFERGMVLYAESPLEEESLGPRLVRDGTISPGAAAEAAEHIDDDSSAPELGRVLLQRELIGRSTLVSAVRSMVEDIVESVFAWEVGSGRFVETELPDTVFETDVLVTFDIILRGIFRMAGFEPIYEAMRGLDNRLRVRESTPLPLQQLTLSPAHGFILSRVDGNSSLTEVLSILPPGEEEVASRFIFGLLVLGLLEYDPTLSTGPFKVADILKDYEERQALESAQEQMIQEVCVRIRDQNPHEVLGVPPSADGRRVEAAYAQLKEQFKRESVLPRVRERLRTELTLIESRLIEAYLTLTSPTRARASLTGKFSEAAADDVAVSDLNVRVEIDRAKSKLALDEALRNADRFFAKARKFMRDGDFHNAIQYTRLAIAQNPSDARYYFALADCLARNPEARWQRMAEENLAKATELDPWNAEIWMSLGRLYKRQGLRLRAKKQFEEALKLVPNNPDVLKELKSVS